MKNLKFVKISLIFTLTVIAAIAISTVGTYADEETKTVSFERAISYDIWCNALGVWTSLGSPGSYVNFDSYEGYSIDSDMKLTDVKVEIIKPLKTFMWYNMCVTTGTVKTLSFNSSGVKFSVGAFLKPIFAPVQLMRFLTPNLIFNGYRYYFKIRITLTYNGSSEVSEETPSNISKYKAEADLFMPDTSYKGHKTLLQDLSTFSLNREFYTAYSFYKKGLGTNSFTIKSGPGEVNMQKCSEDSAGYYSDRIARFESPGDYTIQLSANVTDGMTSVDTEKITILPVPEIKGTLTGKKTALSKQQLDITAALDPSVPLSSVSAEIKKADNSEKVYISCTPGEKSKSSGNTSTIKTRDLELTSVDDEFAHFKLEFITKNKTDEDYVINLTVTDGEGKSDTHSLTYTATVDPGLNVKISGDKTTTRLQNSNVANIKLKDITDTAGISVERKWEYWNGSSWTEDFTFTDASLGSGKNIVAKHEGVGKCKFRLTLKKVYNEDNSLPEYIDDDDRGGGTTVFETEIINVNPYVSFKNGSNGKANLILLYQEGREEEALAEKEYLTSSLAENGITGNVSLRKIIGNVGESNNYGSFHVISRPFSFAAQLYSYEADNYICDSERMYRVEATYGSYGGGVYEDEPQPEPPYYIIAYDIESGEELWTSSISAETFDMGNVFSVNQDDREEYLYISNSSSTLVVDKEDGAVVSTLSSPVSEVYKTDNYLFSVEDDIIRKINLKSGKSETLFSGNISGESEMLKGLINFSVIEDGSLRRKTIDPETDIVEDYGKIFGTSDDANLGFDTRGYMLVGSPCENTTISLDEGWASNVKTLNLYDENANLVKSIDTGLFNNGGYTFKNAAGEFAYTICGYNSTKITKNDRKTVTYYINNFIAYSYGTETTYKTYSNSQKNSYMSSPKTMLGYLTDTGYVTYSAANHGYSWNSGITYNNTIYTCRFTIKNGICTYSKGSGISSVYSTDYDNCFQGDNSSCLQYTYGNPQKDGISGSASAFAPYYKTLDTLIEYDLDRYLRDNANEYNGIFIMSDSTAELTDTDNNRFYNVDNSNELRASVDDFINYLSSKQVGSSDNIKLIFSKGEKVNIDALYSDYEGDKSKKSCYVYYHYPYNDGANSNVNYITDEDFNIIKCQNEEPRSSPITVFNYDGMYKVEHWQYDSTGNPEYDKKSNVATMIFFIRSDAAEALPEVDSIKLSPTAPRAGQKVSAEIKVSDSMSKTLKCKIEVFKNEEKISEQSYDGLEPDYPAFSLTAIENAESGTYTIVCTVTDGKRTNIKSQQFSVLPGYSVSSEVNHTNQWNINREKYNNYLFGNSGNFISEYSLYKLQTAPRQRGTNVFWSEEKICLKTGVEGEPLSVKAIIKGSSCTTELKATGEKDTNGNTIYEGSLWSTTLKEKFGKNYPVEALIYVTATYEDGTSASSEYTIIFDDSDDYWRVHKLY